MTLSFRSNDLLLYLAFSITIAFISSTPYYAHASSQSSSSSLNKPRLVVGVDGGTESIRACCFNANDGSVVGKSCAVAYRTSHPEPGWAEQSPLDWYENLCLAVRGALDSVGDDDESEDVRSRICAICIDSTCCSVVALDEDGEPLRPSLLWMDARSAKQTREIFDKCKGDPSLNINCGGEGPLSAEWMIPKVLWIHQNEPHIWKKARTICEYQDYVNLKLTGELCASSCNAAARWHWNGEEAILPPTKEIPFPGRPLSLYETLGIPDLADKLPQRCLPMGSLVGSLSATAASHLSLPEGLPVAQGGPDAIVGMVGLGCIYPGQLCLITGSSHLQFVVSADPSTSPGTWGAYKGAPIPGVCFAEGGQSSTGSIIRWAKNLFSYSADGETLSYKDLDEEAAKIPPGSDGLVALETFQGSRTPTTDPLARGALVGFTLSHTRGHIWRSLMEAVCLGTRACVDALSSAGHDCNEIVIAGGATRSPLWLQMHADVTGKPVVVCENSDAPLLGCAILASVGAGVHESVHDAVNAMVRKVKRVHPDPEAHETYTSLFREVYEKLSPSLRPVVHAISELRGGGGGGNDGGVGVGRIPFTGKNRMSMKNFPFLRPRSSIRGGDLDQNLVNEGKHNKITLPDNALSPAVISPSLLASDWSNMRGEIKRCEHANVSHLHVDVFDGVYLDSPYALTFGPQMVQAIRRSCNSNNQTILDVHLCVDRPHRYVDAMASAGADRLIFQWEAVVITDPKDDNKKEGSCAEKAIRLAKQVKDAGMMCGISINPSTDVEDIYALLQTGYVDLVDVLAVEPGFGGQRFQEGALTKLSKLRQWRDERHINSERQGGAPQLKLLVDGGINGETAPLAVEAGADILVAGTFLFQHPKGFNEGVAELRQRMTIS